MDAPVTAALIVASAGFAASMFATIAASRAQVRLSWHAARRPHYIEFVEAAARAQAVQSRLADLLRAKAGNFRVLFEQREIRREINEAGAAVRRALFSVQLVATPQVFEAADQMLTILAAGSAVLERVSDDKTRWPEFAAQLDSLGEALLDARDEFVVRAREDLRLPVLSERVSSAASVEKLLVAIAKDDDRN